MQRTFTSRKSSPCRKSKGNQRRLPLWRILIFYHNAIIKDEAESANSDFLLPLVSQRRVYDIIL
jgi:hypothetical protein